MPAIEPNEWQVEPVAESGRIFTAKIRWKRRAGRLRMTIRMVNVTAERFPIATEAS